MAAPVWPGLAMQKEAGGLDSNARPKSCFQWLQFAVSYPFRRCSCHWHQWHPFIVVVVMCCCCCCCCRCPPRPLSWTLCHPSVGASQLTSVTCPKPSLWLCLGALGFNQSLSFPDGSDAFHHHLLLLLLLQRRRRRDCACQYTA
ncbi:hypothetical protein LY76DRAFT_161881 [Colletotrichum caudatum]|nr:hypothetical protein LY76DRAFT_161881 [Colletotrichum caudatum]